MQAADAPQSCVIAYQGLGLPALETNTAHGRAVSPMQFFDSSARLVRSLRNRLEIQARVVQIQVRVDSLMAIAMGCRGRKRASRQAVPV